MRRTTERGGPLALLAVALLLPSACAAARPLPLAERTIDREVVMVAVTWNVHESRGDLGLLVDDLANGHLTGQPVTEFVIFLQETIEGGPHDVTSVARERNLSTYFVPVRVTDRGVSGNAILSTRPLLEVRTIDLPRIRRVRKAGLATIEIDGQRLFAVCAHFENRVGWFEGVLLFSERARARQAEALLDSLPEGPGVLGGDFNTWLGEREVAWRALLRRFDDTPTDRLAPTFRDRLVLDQLFFDLPARWEGASAVVPNRYGSDHHPVVGVIVERQDTGRRASRVDPLSYDTPPLRHTVTFPHGTGGPRRLDRSESLRMSQVLRAPMYPVKASTPRGAGPEDAGASEAEPSPAAGTGTGTK